MATTTATMFVDVCAPETQLGDLASVSGKLVQAVGSQPVEGASITVALTSAETILNAPGTITTDSHGRFKSTFDTSTLAEGSYTCVVSFAGNDTYQAAPDASQTLMVFDVPSVAPCSPCTDLLSAAKRVLRDPNVNKGIGDWLMGAARRDASADLASLQEKALTSFANAVTGRDAVRAKGPTCIGQLRLFFELEDAVSGKRTPLDSSLLPNLVPQLIDANWNVAASTPTFDGQSILYSSVEAGVIQVALAANIAEGTEILDEYYVKEASQTDYSKATRGGSLVLVPPPSTTGGTTSSNGGSPSQGSSKAPTETEQANQSDVAKKGSAFERVVDDAKKVVARGEKDIEDAVSRKRKPDPTITETTGQPTATASAPPSTTTGTSTAASSPNTFQARIRAGAETWIKLILRPPAARVRCFSLMDGDDCCGQGKQYISRVAISATQGADFIACRPTGSSGCSAFLLNPGWYNFSAPEEITIDDCNYVLGTSSPIAAFLGAGQGCSDIYFSYKKKGNEIIVISEIESALGGDPYETAKENFPGMQYLLLREGDLNSAQQQTTTAGAPVLFKNLSAGTYQLFCQAPATNGSQPVSPVSPANGRLTLRLFAGQKSRVPVRVTFRNSITAPAVLDGYVRDEAGQAVPQQLVQAFNDANCLVAAGLTDSNGYYSIQIYSVTNLTLIVGTQQVSVSRSQLQAAMRTVGSLALPSPNAEMNLEMQTAQVTALQ